MGNYPQNIAPFDEPIAEPAPYPVMRRGRIAPQSDRVSHNLPVEAEGPCLARPALRDPQNSM
jgi:hypothetical protein